MTTAQTTIAWIVGGILLLAILVGVFLLAWHGTLNAGDVIGVVGTVIGIAGGVLGVHAGVTAGTKAASTNVQR